MVAKGFNYTDEAIRSSTLSRDTRQFAHLLNGPVAAQFSLLWQASKSHQRDHKKFLLLLVDDCPQPLVQAGICTYTGEHHWLACLLLSMWPTGSVASCGAVVPRALILLGKLSGIAANNVIPRICVSLLTVVDWCRLTLSLSGINSGLAATKCPGFQFSLYGSA